MLNKKMKRNDPKRLPKGGRFFVGKVPWTVVICLSPGDENLAPVLQFHGKDPWAMVCPPPGDENPRRSSIFAKKDMGSVICPPPEDENPRQASIFAEKRRKMQKLVV
ncbi:hypothetical protein ACWNXI_13240 [Caldibacillus thermoamylovorans]